MEDRMLEFLQEIYNDYKDTQQELLQTREALESRKFEARKKFNAALCKVQAELKNAKKTKKNPHFRSSYADLQDYISEAQPILTKHGFSVVQKHKITPDGKVALASILKHVDGHEEESEALLQPKDSTNPQQVGSYNTYTRRMLLSSTLNISSSDDDGEQAVDRKTITAKQYTYLLSVLEKKPNRDKNIRDIINGCNIKKLEEIPISKFSDIINYYTRKD